MTSANLTTSHSPYNERRLADCKHVRIPEEPAPNILLTRQLGEAIKGKDFSRHTFGNLSFEFWKRDLTKGKKRKIQFSNRLPGQL